MDQVDIEPGGGDLRVPALHFRWPRLPVVDSEAGLESGVGGWRVASGDSGSNVKQ